MRHKPTQAERIYHELAAAAGAWRSHEDLAAVMGYQPATLASLAEANDRIVRHHICALRRRLAGTRERVVTHYGVGYRLVRETAP